MMHLVPGTSVVDKIDDVAVSTRWHRAHGRQTRRQRAVRQQLLTPQQEKALVDHLLQLHRNGYPARVKHLRSLAGALMNNGQEPAKDWPQAFYKRHPELKAVSVRAIDWQRHEKNIRVKVEHWFEIMDKQLSQRDIVQENVYNMDETGVLLSDLNTVKVIVSSSDARRNRGVGLRRTMITAVECISADGRCLAPLIIWPGKTLRATWVSHDTPGWHYACNETGYMNSKLNLYWVGNVFDPSTKDRVRGRPRILIVDGFNTHASEAITKFCFENNIILCRQPSHATHKTQPCDVGVFSPLKTAYREQVDMLYRGGAETVNKAHFTMLYSRARDAAMTSRNIRSGWSKAGLSPFNPRKVLDDMQETPDSPAPAVAPATIPFQQSLSSPTSLRTPTDMVSFAALQRKLEEQPLCASAAHPYVQKLLNAAERTFAERELLKVRNENLMQQNNEKKARKHVKERKIGDAKVMSFDDILEAKRLRECAEAEETRKKIEREEKKAEKERQKALKEQVKAEKEKEKAEMAREKAAKARTGGSTRPGVNNTEPARKKRANIGEAALDRQHIKIADLSAYCSVLSFEPTK
jgi:hypothetical protein